MKAYNYLIWNGIQKVLDQKKKSQIRNSIQLELGFKLHFVNWVVTFEGKEVQSQTELGTLEILRRVR